MARIEKSVLINASPEAVWDFGLAADAIPQWFVGVAGVNVHGAYPDPGSALELVFSVPGVDFTVNLSMTVSEVNPYDSLIFALEGMASGVNAWYHQAQDGGVLLTNVIEYEIGGGILGRIADRLMVEKQVESQITQSLANYKAHVEG